MGTDQHSVSAIFQTKNVAADWEASRQVAGRLGTLERRSETAGNLRVTGRVPVP